MPVFTARSTEPEKLDFEALPPGEIADSLADIRWVNRNLGGLRAFRRVLAPLVDGDGRVRLLDAGCGSGDVAAAVAAWAPRRIQAVGVDLKTLHLREAPPGVHRVAADVRLLPFANGTFDVVLCSLFLHHFDGAAAADVLRLLYAQARRALVVNDLRRAFVPYAFGRIVFPWIFRSAVSVHDGLLSIRRSFTVPELRAAFEAAGIPHVEIRRSFPYRLVAIARRPAP
jgi:SAM-dependent methyltransferase